ncbi:MAG TPA: DUF4382 domain-containing protein [Bacteroidia bacterium]|jgi:hypothetical protein|nr:DUF4382 domain-containing protein [Bacteroidia bacterium]
MKKKSAIVITVLLTGCSLFFLPSCKKDSISDPSPRSAETGAVKINLTDAPGDYLQVNIDLKQVRIHIADDSTSNDGWIDLPTNKGIYNLLDLQNGIDTTIVDSTIVPTGKVSQIRFVLGPNSTLMTKDSVIHDLKIPSGEQSGLKINVHRDILGGQTFNILLDFDVDKSIIEKGNGSYSMKPVIKIK